MYSLKNDAEKSAESKSEFLANMSYEVRIKQILSNLISNAIKFTEGDEITIRSTVQAKEDTNCTIKI
ncbi:MAG: hypothetical protein HRT72_05640 [Flavobacteriales bacterium]|nr:hypothetical protein [Flavobacteriales bacterium]